MYWNARLRLHQVLCVLYCNKALSIPPATQASLSSISLSSRSRKGIGDREEGKKGGGWGERVSLAYFPLSRFSPFSSPDPPRDLSTRTRKLWGHR